MLQVREREQALAEMKARQAAEAKLLAEEEQALQVCKGRRVWGGDSVFVAAARLDQTVVLS